MVEIIYGEHSQQADLAGKSVAEVRELYQPEFSIPDRAKASLNGKPLKKKLETETKLGDGDQLSFEEKSRRELVVVGAFLLTLAITGGLFAYAFTTDSLTIGVTPYTTDYGSVSDNGTNFDYDIVGRLRGTIAAGTLFNVSRDPNYSGDLEVNVYLSNADELTDDYSFWMLRVEFTDSTGTPVDIEGITRVISLDNPSVSFAVTNASMSETRYVKLLGGSFRTFPGSWLTGKNPQLIAEVVQAGGPH